MDEARRNSNLYEEAYEAQREWADQQSTNLEYYYGAHWTTKQKTALLERGQAPVTIQTMYQIVEQAVGVLTAKSPAWRATPREDSDRKIANLWSDLAAWMWDKSRGQARLTNIVRDNFVQSRGVAYVYPDWDGDFGRGEVRFTDLDPKEVFPDPKCTDPLWDDAQWVLVRRILSLHQIKEIWGDEVARLVEEKGKSEESWPWAQSRARLHDQKLHPADVQSWTKEAKRYEVIERFERVKRPHWRLFNLESGTDEVLTTEEYAARRRDPAFIVSTGGVDQIMVDPQEVAQFDQLFDQFGELFHYMPVQPVVTPDGQMQQQPPVPMSGPEHEGAIPGSETLLQPTTIGGLVDAGHLPATPFKRHQIRIVASSGDVTLYDPQELPIQHYPLVVFPNASNRNPFPVSDVDRLRDLQDLVNKSQSLILAHLASSTNLKVFYPNGSFQNMDVIENEWSKAGAAMIPYDPVYGAGGSTGGITVVNPPPLPTALYENIDRSIALMERIAGIYAVQQGEPQQSTTTYRGSLVQDEFGLRRMKHRLDGLHESLRRLGQVMVEMAQHVYSDEKVIRIAAPSGQQKEVAVNQLHVDVITGAAEKINDITKGHYDIVVVAGSTLPSNRWAKLEQYLELFDRQIVDDRAVLMATELADAEEILERKSIYAQQQDALEQMQTELKKVMGDLQTAEREAKSAKEKSEMEKFKARLAGFEADIDKQVQLFRFAASKDRKEIEDKQKQQQQQEAS